MFAWCVFNTCLNELHSSHMCYLVYFLYAYLLFWGQGHYTTEGMVRTAELTLEKDSYRCCFSMINYDSLPFLPIRTLIVTFFKLFFSNFTGSVCRKDIHWKSTLRICKAIPSLEEKEIICVNGAVFPPVWQCFSDSGLPLEEGGIFSLPCYYSDTYVVDPNKGGINFWPQWVLKSRVGIIVIFVIPAADGSKRPFLHFCLELPNSILTLLFQSWIQ